MFFAEKLKLTNKHLNCYRLVFEATTVQKRIDSWAEIVRIRLNYFIHLPAAAEGQ